MVLYKDGTEGFQISILAKAFPLAIAIFAASRLVLRDIAADLAVSDNDPYSLFIANELPIAIGLIALFFFLYYFSRPLLKIKQDTLFVLPGFFTDGGIPLDNIDKLLLRYGEEDKMILDVYHSGGLRLTIGDNSLPCDAKSAFNFINKNTSAKVENLT